MPFFRASLALLLILSGFLAPAFAVSAPPPSPVLAAPVEGTLPNGLRYLILPHRTEPGRVSLRLLIRAGSLDEHDDELGYAHFVEHMAYNGTRHYPAGQLVRFFQKTGLTWGADANADTSFTFTNYKLDLPAGHAAHLPEALQILRDFADGLEFSPGEVRRERGVVLSEQRERNTNTYQTDTQVLTALYRGTQIPLRLPIGDTHQIERATAGSLRAFYERCYQPGRMTLLVVGDVEPGDVRQMIEANFVSLASSGPAVAPVTPAPPMADGLRAHLIVNPLATAAVASLVAIVPTPPDTPAGREKLFAGQIVIRALNRRLAERRALAPDRFGINKAMLNYGPDGRFMLHGLEAHATATDWAAAVEQVEHELRRARESGFTSAELAEASATLLTNLRALCDAVRGDPPNVIANRITSALVPGASWHDPAVELAEATRYVADFTPADAAATLRDILPDAGLRLIFNSPKPPAGGADAVLAAYRASTTQPLPAEIQAEAAPLQFRYTDFGPAGAIATQNSAADLGIELVSFANGVRLNLRASPTEPNRFRLAARIGRGTADLPRDKPGLFLLSSSLLGRSDFGRHSREELSRIIQVRGVAAQITSANNQLLVYMTGPSAELPFALRFLTAFLGDVKLEAAKLPQALSDYAGRTDPLIGSIEGFARTEFIVQMHYRDPRFWVAAPARAASYSFDDIAAWIRDHWLQGPLEIGVAGDFKPADAIAAAAASVGTLAPRHASGIADDERLTLAPKPYRNINLRYGSTEKAAVVYFAWPARSLADIRAARALQLATDGLVDRLRITLREEKGVTYAPVGGVERELDQPDFAYAWLKLGFAPDQVKKLAERVNKIADELARRGLTEEEFSRLVEPLRAQAAENLRANEWWLNKVLLNAQGQPGVLDDARSLPVAFAELTREEVNRVAASVFRLANSYGVGASPAPAKEKSK